MIAVVIPGLNTHAQLARVLAELPESAHVFVVDDGSQPPLRAPGARLLRHDRNRGYGAAQKTGYAAALDAGADRIVLLHGDAQYPTGPVLALADALDDADITLGSRFLHDRGRSIPLWRRLGNRALTTAANVRFGAHLTELHTGARAFRAEALRALPLARMSDDYLFDHQLLAAALSRGLRFAERPMTVRYDDAVQSIAPGAALRYALGCLGTLLRAP